MSEHSAPSPNRPVRRRIRPARSAIAALSLAGLLVACSSSGEDPVADVSVDTAPDQTTQPAGERNADGVLQLTAEITGAGPESDPLCTPEPGRKVDDHTDIVIQEEVLPGAYQAETVLPDGRVMPEVDIPEVIVPGYTIDAGCTVVHDAPAGCLGRVEITGVKVPSVTIPGYRYRKLDLYADRVETASVSEVVLEGLEQETQTAEQTCERSADGTITRPTVKRPNVKRSSAYRDGASVAVQCSPGGAATTTTVADSTCPSNLQISGEAVGAVTVPGETVRAETIEVSELDTGTEVLEDEDRTSYVAPAEVLFDTGKSDLKPEAGPALEAILAELEDTSSSKKITVDGHTDDVGGDADNQALSERRAAAVADWLVSKGIDRSRITTTGYGETVPAASGTDDASRAQNRRVVISVAD